MTSFTDEEREAVPSAWPRAKNFRHAIIDTFYKGLKHRPDSTFATFNDDFLAFKDRPSGAGTCAASSCSAWGALKLEEPLHWPRQT